tara:strand:- start:10 stop:312 length:303 start_codon:yes stop_codon:yes gene_type:complete
MTTEKKLQIQEDASFALREALRGVLGQISTMNKEASDAGASISIQCDFMHLEAEIEIALSRHDTHTRYGTNPISHVEQGWQAWKETKPKVRSFPDLTSSG